MVTSADPPYTPADGAAAGSGGLLRQPVAR